MSYVAQSGLDSLLEALRQSGMNTDGVGSGTGASDSASSGPQTPGSGSGAGAGASGSRGGVGGFPFGGFGGFGGAGNGGGRGHGGSGSGYGGDGGHGGPTVDFEFLANDFHLPSKKWLALIIVLALLVIAGAYWWFHPAINIHSTDFWGFVFIVILLPLFLVFWMRSKQYKTGTKEVTKNEGKAKTFRILSFVPVAVVALVAVYLLGLMYFIGQGGFRRIFKHDSDAAASIELVALRAHAPEKKPAGANAEGEKPDDAVPKKAGKRGDRPPRASRKPQRERKREERVYLDRISKQAALLQQHYRLSERETEVMELIARGNTVARIAEDLVVTENTIRTHSKRIYAKLDIHKKQELLDLIESFDPNDLQE